MRTLRILKLLCSSMNNKHSYSLAISTLGLLASGHVMADNYFNPAFLSNDPSAVADLSRFSKNDGQAPGTYRVDIYLNQNFVKTRDVEFKANDNKVSSAADSSAAKKDDKTDADSGLKACITVDDLDQLGVNIKGFSAFKDMKPTDYVSLEKDIPDAKATLDFEKLRLDISIPQAALRNNARGYIEPEKWDQGINALLLNYNFTGSNSKNSGNKSTSDFLSLQSGINLGPWRLRDNSSWNYNAGDGVKTESAWQHVNTYVERTITSLKGELVAGDTSTPSDVFDSLPIRGAQISSDDNMLPDSMRGFAPTIRGIAKSNAQVTIKQDGYTIYQAYVPPGAFAINDLFPTSSSGDLAITVKETDGSEQNYTVPYSNVPILQREGRVKYAVSAGEYHSGNDDQDNPQFGQATIIWGLKNGYTVYGGTQFSDNYRSIAMGLGKNLGSWGALSADITEAHSTLSDDSQYEGKSVRFLYAKSLNDLGTNFQLLGYRYSTQGFYTLDDTAYKKMSGHTSSDDVDENGDTTEPSFYDYYNLYYTKKGKIQVSISQQIATAGSIYVTGSQQSYWNTDEVNTLVQAGYNGTLWDINYSFAYTYNQAPGEEKADQAISLNLSLPIGKWLSPASDDITQTNNTTYASYSNNTDSHGNMTQQAGINGNLLQGQNLSYSVTQGEGNHNVGNSGSTSLDYQGTYGNANAGYSYSEDYKQVNYGLSGGMVLHRNGITLSQPLGDTNVLIAAPGADNVSVENQNGVKTDWRGYAVVPYASTYRENRVALDATSLNDHTDLDESVVSVVPTQGALVRANFNTRVGVRALLTLIHNGKPLPFGATVSRSDTDSGSIVGDAGQVYLSGLAPIGVLKAQWGNAPDQQCSAHYHLPEDSIKQAMTYAQIVCK